MSDTQSTPLHCGRYLAQSANLAGSEFRDVNLSGAVFDDVNLRRATFHNIAFTGTTIRNACMGDVSIEDANYTGMKIDGVLVTDLLKMYRARENVREVSPLLFVRDIARSVAFYRDVLGFAMAASWEPDGKLTWCRMERGAAAIMLQQDCPEDGPAEGRGRGVVFYFNCDDAEKAHAEFTARGLKLAPPETAFYGMRQVSLDDPDGYALCFQSAVNS